MSLLVQMLKESPKRGHRAVGQWTAFVGEMPGRRVVSASDVFEFLQPYFKKFPDAAVSEQQIRKKLTEYVSVAEIDTTIQKKNLFLLSDLHELGRLASQGYVYAVPLMH